RMNPLTAGGRIGLGKKSFRYSQVVFNFLEHFTARFSSDHCIHPIVCRSDIWHVAKKHREVKVTECANKSGFTFQPVLCIGRKSARLVKTFEYSIRVVDVLVCFAPK